MKKTKKRTKQKPLRTLRKTLKFWFHRYIRLRDYGKPCISCGKYMNWGPGYHAGHYYNAGPSYAHLEFDEINTQGQCVKCNTFKEGNKQGYALGLMERYGKDVLEKLRIKLSVAGGRWSRFHYEFLITYYKEKVRELEKKHGIEPAKRAAVSTRRVPKAKKKDWKKIYQKRKNWKPKYIRM